MKTKCAIVLFLSNMVASNALGAPKSFDGITCKSDVLGELIGRRMINDTVKNTESRYRGIQLESLGAFGVEAEGDPWTLVSWRICHREYLILERTEVVRDVLPAPIEGSVSESRIVSCAVDGTELRGTVVIFGQTESEKWPRSVKNAWLINDKTTKFEKISGREVVCR